MKIIVHESDEGHDIKIVIPTGLLFNPVTAMIATPLINKTLDGKLSKKDVDEAVEMAEELKEDGTEDFAPIGKLSRRDMIRFCNEIHRMKRMHKDMPLVEVEDAGGDGVTIWL